MGTGSPEDEITGNRANEPDLRHDADLTTGTPRWVKAFAIVGLILILVFLVMIFTRGPGGRHGPSRHMAAPGPATLLVEASNEGVALSYAYAQC